MKKLIFIFVVAVFAITACKKENTGEMNTPQMNNSQKTEALILAFKDKLDNHLKDGTTYAADSAVWYVEALLNYTFGDASTPCFNPTVDTAERNLNNTGVNGFSLQELADVYDDLKDEVVANQPNNMHVYAIDLFTYPAGNLTVFTTHTAYANDQNSTYKSVTDTAGYWFWGKQWGMCGADSGLYIGMDATDILEGLINTISCDYWTDLEYDGAWPNEYIDPNFPLTNSLLHPTRLFSASGTTPAVLDYCMSPTEIDYYNSSEGIRYIIDDLCPERKSFMYCFLGAYADGYYVVHIGSFTYGVPN
jgi:hypothetical protein